MLRYRLSLLYMMLILNTRCGEKKKRNVSGLKLSPDNIIGVTPVKKMFTTLKKIYIFNTRLYHRVPTRFATPPVAPEINVTTLDLNTLSPSVFDDQSFGVNS